TGGKGEDARQRCPSRCVLAHNRSLDGVVESARAAVTGGRLTGAKGLGMAHSNSQCPCFGSFTLASRGTYNICLVCFWEDDDANEEVGQAALERPEGPNHIHLWQARCTYATFGASYRVAPPYWSWGTSLSWRLAQQRHRHAPTM